MGINNSVSFDELSKFNIDSDDWGASPLTIGEQEYANDINNILNGPEAYPVLDSDTWNDLNVQQQAVLDQEEYDGMIQEDIHNLLKGLTSTDEISQRAAAFAMLRGKLMSSQLTSAAALSAARQLNAEATLQNPSLTSTGYKAAKELEFFSEKDAVLENHIKMADTNASMAKQGFWSKVGGVIADIFPVPGTFDNYSKQQALQALDREDAEWFDRSDNMELFYNMVMTAHQDRRIGPVEFDKLLDVIDAKMAKMGINPYATSVLYDYLKEHNRGTQTFSMIADYGSLAYLGAKGAIKGAATGISAANKAVKLGPAAKAGIGLYEGSKGLVKGVVDSIPFAGWVGDKTVKGADVVLKGSFNNLDKYGRLIKAGNKKAVVEEMAQLLKEAPEMTSIKTKQTLYERVFDSITKPTKSLADDIVASEGPIMTEKAYQGQVRAWINAIKQSSHLSDLMAEAWAPMANKIARALESTGMIEQIIPSHADFKDIMAIVEPIMQKNGDIVARIKMEMLPELLYKMKTDPKLNKYIDDSGQFMFDFMGDASKAEYSDAGKATAENIAAALSKATTGLEDMGMKIIPYLDNGTWKLQAEVATNKGWSTLYKNLKPVPKGQETFGTFLSGLFTSKSHPKDIMQLNMLRALQSEPIQQTAKEVMKAFKGLSKEDKDLMEKLVQMSIHYQAFYTPEHLLRRGVSDKVVDVYSKWRAFNDLDYFVRNKSIRDYLVSMGIKDLSFNDKYVGRGRVLPIGTLEEFKSKLKGRKFLLVNSNDVKDIRKIETLTDTEIEGFYNQGYRIVENLHAPDQFHKNAQVYHLYAGDALVENDLGEFVTEYVAGGRRFFTREGAYLKQIKLERNANNQNIITGVQTFGVDTDIPGLIRRGNVIEGIRKAYVQGNMAEVNRLIAVSGLPKNRFTDADSFGAWASSVGIDLENLDNALEVVKNGVPLSSYDKLVKSGASDLLGPEEMYNLVHRSAFQSLTNESKIAKLRRTGRELFTWDLSEATPVDFEHQMRYMVNDMVHTGVMPYFTKFYADNFAKQFSDYIEGANTMSAEEMLLRGQFKKGLIGDAAKMVSAGETAQKNYRAIRGIPTEFDSKLAQFFNNAIDGIAGKIPVTEDIAHGVRVNWEKFKDMDPNEFLRSMTSTMNLALCNPSQLVKQWASNMAIWAIDPKAAVMASKYHFSFAVGLLRADGNYFKAMKKLATSFGDKPAAVQKDFENMIKMGAFTHGTAGGYVSAGETVGSWAKRISYGPFNVGEMMNRTKAYLAAIYSKGFHGKDMTTADLAEVTEYAQRLFMNMDSTGLSRLQTGTWGKTLMQYMGYRMQWLGTVLADRELTGWQRTRLGLVNAALVGGEGMFGISLWNNLCNIFGDHDKDSKLDPNEDYSEFFQLASQGVLNWVSGKTGLDINLGQILDISIGDLAEEMVLYDKWNIPVVEMTNKVLSATWAAIKEGNKMIFDDYTVDDFKSFLQLQMQSGTFPASSIRNAYIGWTAYTVGKEFNRRGQLTAEDNSALHNFLRGIGFSGLESTDVYRARLQEQSYNKRVSDFKKEIEPLWLQLNEQDSPARRAEFELLVKNAPIASRDKGRVLTEILHDAPVNRGATLLKRVMLRQFERNGVAGNKEIIEFKLENNEGVKQ